MTSPEESGLPAADPSGVRGVWVGLDLGTSGMKAVAMDGSGAVVARSSASYPTARPEPGASEQRPADWLAAARDCMDTLRAEVGARWHGIGLSAMLPTLVTLDQQRRPTGPAITWEDARAEPEGDWLRERCGPDSVYAATGQWLDGRYLLPMHLRAAAASPARGTSTRLLAGAKDYLFGWLTGEIVTDPSTASGYGAYLPAEDGWDPACLSACAERLGAALPALPPVLPSSTLRPLRDSAAATFGVPGGVPVCLGAADSVLGALGLGVEQPGQVAYLGGTSTVIMGISDHWHADAEHRYLLTPTWLDGLYGVEMDLLATGSALRWLAELLGIGERDLMRLAGKVAAEDAPTFLPYLAPGEQGALWDPTLLGTVSGMHLGTTRGHLARGLLNGILMESRRCIEVLRDVGVDVRELRVAGGSASDPTFRQDLADCTGCSVFCVDSQTDQSALGAAILAARATSAGAAARAASRRAGGEMVVRPRRERAAVWELIWDRHEGLHRRVGTDNATMVGR